MKLIHAQLKEVSKLEPAFFFAADALSKFDQYLEEELVLCTIADALIAKYFHEFPYFIRLVTPLKEDEYEILLVDNSGVGILLPHIKFQPSVKKHSISERTTPKAHQLIYSTTTTVPNIFNPIFNAAIFSILEEKYLQHHYVLLEQQKAKDFLAGKRLIHFRCPPLPTLSTAANANIHTDCNIEATKIVAANLQVITDRVTEEQQYLQQQQVMLKKYQRNCEQKILTLRAENRLELATHAQQQWVIHGQPFDELFLQLAHQEAALKSAYSKIEKEIAQDFLVISKLNAEILYGKKLLAWALYIAAGKYFYYIQKERDRAAKLLELNTGFAGVIHIEANGNISSISKLYQDFCGKTLVEINQFFTTLMKACDSALIGTSTKQTYISQTITATTELANYLSLQDNQLVWTAEFSQRSIKLDTAILKMNKKIHTKAEEFSAQFSSASPTEKARKLDELENKATRIQENYCQVLENQACFITLRTNLNLLQSELTLFINEMTKLAQQLPRYLAEQALGAELSGAVNHAIANATDLTNSAKRALSHLTDTQILSEHDKTIANLTMAKEKIATAQQQLIEWRARSAESIAIETACLLATELPSIQLTSVKPIPITTPPPIMTTPLAIPKTTRSTGQQGKLVGAMMGFSIGAVVGGVCGFVLAPFTLGLSIAAGATLGAIIGGGLGLATGAMVDNYRSKSKPPTEKWLAPIATELPLRAKSTSDIQQYLLAEKRNSPPASILAPLKPSLIYTAYPAKPTPTQHEVEEMLHWIAISENNLEQRKTNMLHLRNLKQALRKREDMLPSDERLACYYHYQASMEEHDKQVAILHEKHASLIV